MARTPEHIPHIPHILLPDIRGAARWGLGHWKPVGLSLAVLVAGAGLAIAHDRGPQTSVTPTTGVSNTSEPAEPVGIIIPALPIETPTPAATVSQTPEPTTVPPTPEPPKPLPEVINNQTAKFVTLSPQEIQKMFDESVQKGEPKIPLPDEVVQKDLKVKTIINKNPGLHKEIPLIAFYAEPGQTINMRSLTAGKVITARGSLLQGGSTYNIIEIESSGGIIVSYAYPSGTKWNVKEGDIISIGRVLFSTTFDPKSKGQEQFEKAGSELKGVAIMMNLGKGEEPIGKGVQSILTDDANNVVTLTPPSS